MTVSQGKIAALNRCGGKLKIPVDGLVLEISVPKNICKRAVLVQRGHIFLEHSVVSTQASDYSKTAPNLVHLFVVLIFYLNKILNYL